MTELRPDPAATRDIARALNTCIEVCTDGERGYAQAASDVREPVLRNLFLAMAKQRSDFVLAFQAALTKLGAFAENEGSLSGAAHRAWLDARIVLEGRTDALVFEEWARGEAAGAAACERAFQEVPIATLPDDVQGLVLAHASAMKRGLVDARAHLARVTASLGAA
ncbi:hypothetical protein BH09MYX1_BH09MYX1_56160 [soil metagenome]